MEYFVYFMIGLIIVFMAAVFVLMSLPSATLEKITSRFSSKKKNAS